VIPHTSALVLRWLAFTFQLNGGVSSPGSSSYTGYGGSDGAQDDMMETGSAERE
jgi:hypothetical protein